MPGSPSKRPEKRPHTVLVFQGGGALGAYQAGVFEALCEHGIAPDWVVGTSIGAINAALIAGNPPERRLEQLRDFWESVTIKGGFGGAAAPSGPWKAGIRTWQTLLA